MNRHTWIGALVTALVAIAAWGGTWAYQQYRAGQELHRQTQAAASVLFQAADQDFIITDVNGVKRPATVAEILTLVAKERIAAFKAQQANAPQK